MIYSLTDRGVQDESTVKCTPNIIRQYQIPGNSSFWEESRLFCRCGGGEFANNWATSWKDQATSGRGRDRLTNSFILSDRLARKHQLSTTVWLYHSEVSVQPGLLMRGCRIIIPFSLHQDMLGKIHAGYQGVTKCRVRARQSVWWPRMSKELEDLAKNYPECFKAQCHQPLIPSPVLELPWQKVATDLFKRKWYMYLLIVDYYSPLHWDNSPERSTCQRGDHAHQKHIRKTRNSGSSHIRQRSTICISSISPVCPGLPVWTHYKQSVFPPK